MKARTLHLAAALFLVVPALIAAAAPPPAVQSAAPAARAVAAAPLLPVEAAVLADLLAPAGGSATVAPIPLTGGCGPDFCTQAQRDACNQQCLAHHHGVFVGLQCCTDSCTTICNCGSVPIGC